jgi:hypothetical protein
LSKDRISEYAADMKRGCKFPPLAVFEDSEGVFWLADGFHRYHAAVQVKLKAIACEVRSGGLRDAILHSSGANAAHGIRRTNADKRQAVTKLLKDDEWGKWSDREIARRCNVDHELVGRLREQLKPDTGGNASMDRMFTHPKTGEPTKMKTGNIGGKPESPTLGTSPAVNDAPHDVAQPDKPAPVPEPAAKPVGPEPMGSDIDPQDLALATDAVPPTAPDQPAPMLDPYADQRAAIRNAVHALLKLKDVDFSRVVASMSLEELREARDEEARANGIFFAWSAALDAAIKRARAAEEQMSPAA